MQQPSIDRGGHCELDIRPESDVFTVGNVLSRYRDRLIRVCARKGVCLLKIMHSCQCTDEQNMFNTVKT